MEVLNGKYKELKVKWSTITLPVLPGTPFNEAGEISNNMDAIGICPVTVNVLPLMPCINLLVAGDIEKSQIVYPGLSDDAIRAMSGIRIFKADGSRDTGESAAESNVISWKPTLVDGKLEAQTVNIDFRGKKIALCGNFIELELLINSDQWFFGKAGDTITIPTEEDISGTGESKRTFTFAANGKTFEISDAKVYDGEDPETADPVHVVDNTQAIPYFILFV